jgi:hypothetical protein
MGFCSSKRVGALFAAFFVVAFAAIFALPGRSSAAINSQINFQGKLTNPDGTNVTDGNYSIVFSIYAASSGGSAIWTETQGTVAVASGIFQVALGSVSALPGSVDFNSNSLFLGIKVGADAEMTPRVRLTAAPYAFNADRLDGLDSTSLFQIAPAAVQTDSSTNASMFLNKTGGSGNIVQLQKAGTDVFTIGNGGAVTMQSGTYTQNLVTISNGQTTATPTIPGSYSPALTVRTSQTANSRPLFFGYDNGAGTGWAAYMTSGACGAYTNMCLDFGNGTTTMTALESTGTTLNIGGGDDGNFTNVAFKNTGQITVTATAVPAADQVAITNAGQPVTTAGVNGLSVNFVGGAAAIEASGARVDLTPGTTSGGTWNGLRVVANATGAVTGVNEYGLNLDGPTSPGAGNEVGISIDANWDAGLQLGSKTSDPGTPATDNIYVYARKVAGRTLLRQKGSSGVSFAYQPSIFEQAITYQGPNTGTTVSSFGSAWTVDTTASTPGASEVFGFSTNFATAATANDTAGVAETVVQHYRGSVANGSNGFFYVARVGFPDATYTGNRFFTGLTTQTIATMTNSDTPAGDYAGFQFSTTRADTGFRFITRDNTTTSTGVNTLAIAQNKVYDFYIYTPPQGTTIYWRVDNITDGTTQEGSTTTNLPRNNQPMRAGSGLQTTTATARNFRVLKHYIESDR